MPPSVLPVTSERSTRTTPLSDALMPLSWAPRTSALRTTFGVTTPAKSRTAMPSSPHAPRGNPGPGTTQTPSSTQPIASPT
jgi:hypothetical protein